MNKAIMIIAVFAAGIAFAATAEYGGMTYTYFVSSGKASITKVEGFEKTVTIPSALGGYPVTTLQGDGFQNNTTVQRVVIPETVTALSGGVFQGCISLNTCNIPSGVTMIPDSCFANCKRLHGVVLPAGLKSIGAWAFCNCSSLDMIDFPQGLTSVGNYAYQDCSSLKEAMLPDSVTSLGRYVFQRCPSLVKAHLPNWWTTIPFGLFHSCNSLSEVNIPSGVTSIEGGAFYNCESLRELIVPATVTSVGGNAFYRVQRVVFLGRPPAGLPNASVSTAVYPKEYGELWQAQLSIAQTGGFVKENMPSVKVVSATVRENSPTIMDVVYKVTSTKQTVKVRAIAFEDGVRSFANVTRVETLVDGTGVNVGDSVAANVEHTISWNVAADLQTDLANIVVEVLAIEDDILPLELTTIPANGTNRAMEISWNLLGERQVFDALLWLYADKDPGLTLTDGVLKNGDITLCNGTTLSLNRSERRNWDGTGYYYKYFNDDLDYIFSKMGFATLTGDTLTYANSMTRMGLSPSGIRQYAYRWINAQ